jgi:hypothetical protein
MAKERISRSPGSIILELAIALLVVLLLLAILYPKKLWDKQDLNQQISRERMENIHFAAKFYHKVTKSYTDNLNEIISFAESESLKVHPAGFKMDRLTREDSGIDSFVVEYYDPYQLFRHFKDTLGVEYMSADSDSVMLTIEPMQKFPFVPVTRYSFAADQPIHIKTEFRGDQGVMTFVGSQGIMRGQQFLGESTIVRASEYIYSINKDEIDKCPTTGEMYNLAVNVRVQIRAEIKALIEKNEDEQPLLSSQLISSLTVYRMLKQADAKANRTQVGQKVMETVEDSLLSINNIDYLNSIADMLKSDGKIALSEAIFDSLLIHPDITDELDVKSWEAIRDSSYTFLNKFKESESFISLRDSIVNSRKELLMAENFVAELDKLEKEGKLTMMENGTITTTSDSIEFYSDSDLIKNRLFKAKNDKVTQYYLSQENVKSVLDQFSFVEIYSISKVDSVGITIASPVVGQYINPNRSFLDRLFSVSGETNHGKVVNGDLSWSERR